MVKENLNVEINPEYVVLEGAGGVIGQQGPRVEPGETQDDTEAKEQGGDSKCKYDFEHPESCGTLILES